MCIIKMFVSVMRKNKFELSDNFMERKGGWIKKKTKRHICRCLDQIAQAKQCH